MYIEGWTYTHTRTWIRSQYAVRTSQRLRKLSGQIIAAKIGQSLGGERAAAWLIKPNMHLSLSTAGWDLPAPGAPIKELLLLLSSAENTCFVVDRHKKLAPKMKIHERSLVCIHWVPNNPLSDIEL